MKKSIAMAYGMSKRSQRSGDNEKTRQLAKLGNSTSLAEKVLARRRGERMPKAGENEHIGDEDNTGADQPPAGGRLHELNERAVSEDTYYEPLSEADIAAAEADDSETESRISKARKLMAHRRKS